jgi:hypothetical protein
MRNYFVCLKVLLSTAILAGIAACGGGGGSAGAVTGAGINTNTQTTVVTARPDNNTADVSNFTVVLLRSSIANTGAEIGTLTVTALDRANNIVKDATVTVSTNNNSIFTPSNSNGRTDDRGVFSGFIGIGQDKSDRVINARVTINGTSKTVGLQVQGSQVTVNVVPAVAPPGGTVTLTVDAKDANGTPIPNAVIAISGALTTNMTTNLNGVARVIFTVPSTAGTYNINATGSGVQALSHVVVGSTVPSAILPAGVVPSFSISPNVIAPNIVGSAANQANFRFLLLDSANQPIPNVRVRFQKNGTGLGYDGTITTGANAVITNASGVAASSYIAGLETSPTNGVSIRACYKATDFIDASDCPFSAVAALTVAGGPVSISIGDDGLLQKATAVYSQKFAVTVVDAAGRAVAGAPISFSLDITHYAKGEFSVTNPPIIDTPYLGALFICPNEDANRSKNLDPSEDINNNGVLDPRSSDVLISADTPGVTSTDANGVILLRVTWLQSVASWEIFRIKVTTNVTGSESTASASFRTNYVVGDDGPGIGAPFKTPPYGAGQCSERN